MSQELFRRTYKQWTLIAREEDYVMDNSGPDGRRRFFSLVMGPYGNPMMDQEPDLKLSIPSTLSLVDAEGKSVDPKPGWGISGIICRKKDDTIAYRTSMSNPNCPPLRWEGNILKVGEEWWYPKVLFDKDRDRFVGGYVLFCSENSAEHVRVLELQDICF